MEELEENIDAENVDVEVLEKIGIQLPNSDDQIVKVNNKSASRVSLNHSNSKSNGVIKVPISARSIREGGIVAAPVLV